MKRAIMACRGQRGSVMIIVALMLTVIVGCGAIALDVGRIVVEKQSLQSAVDAAALAAAAELPDTQKATAAANYYITQNGYSTDNITVYFTNSNKRVGITATERVDYTLARALGFSNETVSKTAEAEKKVIDGVFGYTLFSGSETVPLYMNGSIHYIGGSVHTNHSFIANGSMFTVTNVLEATKTITINGSNISVGSRVQNASVIAMPNFTEEIRAAAQAAGAVYTGSRYFNSTNITVNGGMYVDGSITISGSGFKGKGCILATGDITINGSCLNASSDSAVCFYSQNGNITINGSNATFDGMVYAPNGSVTLNGSGQRINGRVISKTVAVNGSDIRIQSGTSELTSLPTSRIALVR